MEEMDAKIRGRSLDHKTATGIPSRTGEDRTSGILKTCVSFLLGPELEGIEADPYGYGETL